MAGKPVSSGLAVSPWFPLAVVGAVLILIVVWGKPQWRGVALLIAAAIFLGWVLRAYPTVKQQVTLAATGKG